MVEEFIKNENCIILAVSPAIDDIANSEVTPPYEECSSTPLIGSQHPA